MQSQEVCQAKNGITLIALLIIMIVILILVFVGKIVLTNGGVFTADKNTKDDIIVEEDEEQQLYQGEEITLPEGWSRTTKPTGWTNRVVAITDGTNIIPLPQGYSISTVAGETTVEEGLVIKDSKENEFVWIPVSTEFTSSYSFETYHSEAIELTYNDSKSNAPRDSQATLDYYYGEKYFYYPTNDAEKSDATKDFAYAGHYAEMVSSVNKYDGFYIGRYETTIDANNQIGSKFNETVLTADKSIQQTNDKECRWWGLYYIQRNSNVDGNKTYLQTNMIWGQQWEAMLTFIGSENASSTISGTQSEVLKSGEATYDNNEKDKMNNIYDLRRNGNDWTAEANKQSFRRCPHGGNYGLSSSADSRFNTFPNSENNNLASRLTLYIK